MTDTNDPNSSMYDYGAIDFWDEPGEDIYTNEDGELINEAFE